jgi:alginate O-acetyltransferase complex protein AlgI
MLFNSPLFVVFFATVLCLYWWIGRRKRQNAFLLIASYVFYGTWSLKFLALLWFSTVIDYTCGRLLGASENPRRRRTIMIVSIIVNLTLLGTFKYAGFFVLQAADLLQLMGFQPHLPVLQIVLPIGISFYTFQSLGYVVDVYRRKLEPVRNFLDYALFVAFFPQLVAGPIERATHMLPQYASERVWSRIRFESGLQLMVWGLFKKMVIADNLAPYVNAVYGDPGLFSGSALVTATIFFAFQIYCDFSGYSDIARGTARTLGFDLLVNFDLPYFSKSPVEFWRRWHISLSQWFQDYLYFPLAMYYMRKGRGGLTKYNAHIIAMGLIGFWHGANWTFIAFGLYWGVAIAAYLHHTERRARRRVPPNPADEVVQWRSRLQGALAIAAMFAVACVGWVLFRAESIGQAAFILSRLMSPIGLPDVRRAEVLSSMLLWTMVIGLWLAEWCYRTRPNFVEWLTGGERRRLVWRHAMIIAILFSYVVAQQGKVQPFIYFQF